MTLRDDITVLSGVSLFEDLESDVLRLIAFGAQRRRIPESQTLFREAAKADAAYVVAAGRLRLTRRGPDGQPIALGTAETGALLGEIAMISSLERTMTAVAETESEVIRIDRTLFHRMLEEYPDVAAMVQARIAQRFAGLMEELAGIKPRFEG